MLYPLVITIAAAVLIVALLGGAVVLARGIAQGEGLAVFRGWRWFPSPLAIIILVPLLAIVAVRAAPLLLLVPLALPLLWRSRRLAGPGFFLWNLWRDDARRRDDDTPRDGGDTWPYRN